MGNTQSSGGSSSSAPSTITTINDSVLYSLCLDQPEQPQVEVVFIHGLQGKNFEDAYWKTWLARDGSNECWPGTWLKSRMPRARILSLSYDSSALRTSNTGRIDLYAVGQNLLTPLLDAGVGQNNCPVVFVCHSLGGLVAKQIVITAQKLSSSEPKARVLLENIKGFFFYATPHSGSELAEYAKYADNFFVNLFIAKSPLVEYLEVLNKETGKLNADFEQVHRLEYPTWRFFVIGETHETKLFGPMYKMIVPEASAKLVGVQYLGVAEDHINVCKPKTPLNGSFIKLVDFIKTKVMEENQLPLQLEEIVNEDLT